MTNGFDLGDELKKIHQKIDSILDEMGFAETNREELTKLGEDLFIDLGKDFENVFRARIEQFFKFKSENPDLEEKLLIRALKTDDPEKFIRLLKELRKEFYFIPEIIIARFIEEGIDFKLDKEEIKKLFYEFVQTPVDEIVKKVQEFYEQLS